MINKHKSYRNLDINDRINEDENDKSELINNNETFNTINSNQSPYKNAHQKIYKVHKIQKAVRDYNDIS